MTYRIIGALIITSVLGACSAKPLPMSASPINVTPVNKAAAIGADVYGTQRAENPNLPKFKGVSTVVLRTYYDGEELGDRKEIGGAKCSITASNLYTAEATSPATLVVPNYGGRSPLVSGKCTSGTMMGEGTAEIYNLRTEEIRSASSGAGLIGFVVGAAIAHATADENDPYLYRDLAVDIK